MKGFNRFILIVFFTLLYANELDQNYRILNFLFMEDLDYNGKMTFRQKIDDIKPYKNMKCQDLECYKYYYKVYHDGLPKIVEKRRMQTDEIKIKYYFDTNATVYKTEEFLKDKKIICHFKYYKNKKIKECNNGYKSILFFQNGTFVKELDYYKNQLEKIMIAKNNNIYIYDKNKKLVKITDFGYIEPDNIPIEIKKNDVYPWK